MPTKKKTATPASSKGKRPGIANVKAAVAARPLSETVPVLKPQKVHEPRNYAREFPLRPEPPSPGVGPGAGLAQSEEEPAQDFTLPEDAIVPVEAAPYAAPPARGFTVPDVVDSDILFDVPDVDPYDEEQLRLVKLPKNAGPKVEELDPAMPMVEFLSDLPALIKRRQTIDACIDDLEGQKKKLSATIFGNLQVSGLKKVVVGYFQPMIVQPEKPKETFTLETMKTFLLTMGVDADIISAAVDAATETGPPGAPYLKVSDLRKNKPAEGEGE